MFNHNLLNQVITYVKFIFTYEKKKKILGLLENNKLMIAQFHT